jgi:hypothetical protein
MFRDSQTSHLAVTGELRPRGATSGLYRESSGTDQRAILWQNILQLIEVYLKENLGTLSPAAQATATKVRMLGGINRGQQAGSFSSALDLLSLFMVFSDTECVDNRDCSFALFGIAQNITPSAEADVGLPACCISP